MAAKNAKAPEPVSWVAGALINKKIYLFDSRVGLPVPGPGGVGVANLDDAIAIPEVLAALDLPGRSYATTRADLAAGKIRVLIESSLGMLSPRMRLLQLNLVGKNRMVLFRDPSEQAAAFQESIGSRCEKVELWNLPLEVEYRLFNDGMFVRSALFTLQVFEAKWPLLAARLTQLRGDLAESVQRYVAFRFAENTLETDGKTPIPHQVQQIMDMFATYYLALGQLDRNDKDQARFLFNETLRLFPEPGPGKPFFNMYRWGAQTNLGLLCAERGEDVLAIRYLTQDDPTTQAHGNLWRARGLIWKNPFVPPPGIAVPPSSQPPADPSATEPSKHTSP